MNYNATSLDEKLLLAYYGELDEKDQRELDALLATDSTLRQRYSLLAESLNSVKRNESEELSERYWASLEKSILNQTVNISTRKDEKTHVSWWASLSEMFLTPQRIGFTLAGGLAFLLIGVFVGSNLQVSPTTGSVVFENPTDALQQANISASSAKLTDFLKRSQIYFATSVDEEVQCEKCLPIRQQMPNKKIAQELLIEAAALKAQSKSNPEMEKLITDIEFVLNNIGNNESINPAQAEMVHHVASNAVCEVAAKIDSAKSHSQPK